MSITRLRASVLASALSTLAVVACGSGGSSTFGAEGGSGGDTLGGGAGSGGTFGSGSSDAGPFGVAPDAACVTASAKAEGSTAYLVFMFDKSGSMKDASKWTSCAAGLKTFFGDPSSAGIQASLQFFSQADQCSVPGYTAPLVTMEPLPDATTFGSAIDATQPSGETPTLPAIQGAIAYAKQIQTQHQDGKVAVVLVTDGEPNGCNSSVANVSAAAAAVAQSIPTYVIGVGSSLTNLNAIAQSGGTNQAILVSTTTPADITKQFEAAIGQIKQQALSCDYTIPPPPSGQTLDPNSVNVLYTAGSGAADTLTYDATCAGPGWRYDDPAAPHTVTICPASCTTVKADAKGRIDVLFGCATQGGVPR